MIDNTFHDQVLRRPIEPKCFLEAAVVVGAEQAQVVQAGGAAVDPGADVVGLGPGGGSGAAREAAAAVAGGQRPALCG